uniref:Large ribosomal subunit protein uL23c n=1 Tax=Pseudocodium devriesii TaxID=453070 RepID=A0A386B133_9CHLO|nr:ribosomal protein L23 [Pseudocodium devriesii]AYC65412.1 ribosomal protein L23 [Pseudocodium devriesii]
MVKNLSVQWNQRLFDCIQRPIITEKTTKLMEQSIYTFEVDAQLTKKQIKAIFQEYYNQPIKSITTLRKGLKKRARLCFYESIKEDVQTK